MHLFPIAALGDFNLPGVDWISGWFPGSHEYLSICNSNFRRNATHCIWPIAIEMCVCVCVCACVCVYVCMLRLWTPGKRFEVETSCFCTLREMKPDIACKSFTETD